MKNSLVYLFIALLLLFAAHCQEDDDNQLIQVGTLTSNATMFYSAAIPNPISIRVSQNGTVFVAYQQGFIHVIMPGTAGFMLLDISTLVTPADPAILDRGLIGFDLHRDFERNGLFYVFYTAPAATPGADLCPAGVLNSGVTCEQINSQINHVGKLVEYKWDRINPIVETRVLFVLKHPFNGGHSWNTLKYNRYQNRLYLALGDAGCANDPFGLVQNRNYFAGKVISFDMNELAWACAEPVATFSDLSSLCNASVGRIVLEGFGLRNPSGLMFSNFGDDGEFGLDHVGNVMNDENGNDDENENEFENDEWNYLIFDNTPQYGEINYAIGDELPNFGWPHLDSNICHIGFNRSNLCPELESLVPTELLGLFKIPIATVPVNPGFTYPTISSGVILGRSFLRTIFNASNDRRKNLDNLILFSAPANGTSGVNGTAVAGSSLYAVRIRSDYEQQFVNDLDRCSEEEDGSQGWGLGRLVEEMDVRQLIPIPITAGVDPGAVITTMYNDGRQIYFGLSTGVINVLRLAKAAPVVTPTGKK